MKRFVHLLAIGARSLVLILLIPLWVGCSGSETAWKVRAPRHPEDVNQHCFVLVSPGERPSDYPPSRQLRLNYIDASSLNSIAITLCFPEYATDRPMKGVFSVDCESDAAELFLRRLQGLVDVPEIVDPSKGPTEADRCFFGALSFLFKDHFPTDDSRREFRDRCQRLLDLGAEAPKEFQVILRMLRAASYMRTEQWGLSEAEILEAQRIIDSPKEPWSLDIWFLQDRELRLAMRLHLARIVMRIPERQAEAMTMLDGIIEDFPDFKDTVMYREALSYREGLKERSQE